MTTQDQMVKRLQELDDGGNLKRVVGGFYRGMPRDKGVNSNMDDIVQELKVYMLQHPKEWKNIDSDANETHLDGLIFNRVIKIAGKVCYADYMSTNGLSHTRRQSVPIKPEKWTTSFVRGLPPIQREIVGLRRKGYTYKQIAAMVKRSVDYVGVVLYTANRAYKNRTFTIGYDVRIEKALRKKRTTAKLDTVYRLRYHDGWRNGEIAEHLGVSNNTVNGWLFRVRTMIIAGEVP